MKKIIIVTKIHGVKKARATKKPNHKNNLYILQDKIIRLVNRSISKGESTTGIEEVLDAFYTYFVFTKKIKDTRISSVLKKLEIILPAIATNFSSKDALNIYISILYLLHYNNHKIDIPFGLEEKLFSGNKIKIPKHVKENYKKEIIENNINQKYIHVDIKKDVLLHSYVANMYTDCNIIINAMNNIILEVEEGINNNIDDNIIKALTKIILLKNGVSTVPLHHIMEDRILSIIKNPAKDTLKLLDILSNLKASHLEMIYDSIYHWVKYNIYLKEKTEYIPEYDIAINTEKFYLVTAITNLITFSKTQLNLNIYKIINTLTKYNKELSSNELMDSISLNHNRIKNAKDLIKFINKSSSNNTFTIKDINELLDRVYSKISIIKRSNYMDIDTISYISASLLIDEGVSSEALIQYVIDHIRFNDYYKSRQSNITVNKKSKKKHKHYISNNDLIQNNLNYLLSTSDIGLIDNGVVVSFTISQCKKYKLTNAETHAELGKTISTYAIWKFV